MVATALPPGQKSSRLVRNAAVRVGIGIGVAASLVLIAWVFLANRVPSLESFAMERNVAAEAVLGFLLLIPVVLFFRRPGRLLVCGLTAWFALSFSFWLLALYFTALSERWSTFQVVMKGVVGYLIAMVVAWVVSAVQRVRRAKVRGLRPTSVLVEPRMPHSDSPASFS